MESFVFHEIQKNLKVAQDIYYWRTTDKDEVDFVIVKDRTPLAVEVKSALSTPDIPDGVKRFVERYPDCRIAVVLNDHLKTETSYRDTRILFAPHYYARIIPLLI